MSEVSMSDLLRAIPGDYPGDLLRSVCMSSAEVIDRLADEKRELDKAVDSLLEQRTSLRERVAGLEAELERAACRAADAEERLRNENSAKDSESRGIGWLTAEERGALERAFDLLCDDDGDNPLAGTVQKLLARLTPPEVVLRSERHSIIYADNKNANRVCRAKDVIEALSAIGVPVKEVGRE